MTWEPEKTTISSDAVFGLLKRHRLEHVDTQVAISTCRDLLASTHFEMVSDGIIVAHAFVSATGRFTFIPEGRFFSHQDVFAPRLLGSLGPVIEDLFGKGLTRLFSEVPVSRSRTKKALKVLGFEVWGKRHKAFHAFGQDPEDVWYLDLLAEGHG